MYINISAVIHSNQHVVTPCNLICILILMTGHMRGFSPNHETLHRNLVVFLCSLLPSLITSMNIKLYMLPSHPSLANCITIYIVFLGKKASKLSFIMLHLREKYKIRRHEKIKNTLIELFFISSVKNQKDPSKPSLPSVP